jgi:hypothetical protein
MLGLLRREEKRTDPLEANVRNSRKPFFEFAMQLPHGRATSLTVRKLGELR